ncbi:MAG: NUDIX domain-containing protein [Acidimicrobiales bacterium]
MTPRQDPPLSGKAALRRGERWVLLRNDRNEWELPGGRIDARDATLQDVVCREELGIDAQVGDLIDSYLFEVIAGRWVTIVCCAATMPIDNASVLKISDEHRAIGLFTTDELDALDLPSRYRRSIEHVAQRCLGD